MTNMKKLLLLFIVLFCGVICYGYFSRPSSLKVGANKPKEVLPGIDIEDTPRFRELLSNQIVYKDDKYLLSPEMKKTVCRMATPLVLLCLTDTDTTAGKRYVEELTQNPAVQLGTLFYKMHETATMNSQYFKSVSEVKILPEECSITVFPDSEKPETVLGKLFDITKKAHFPGYSGPIIEFSYGLNTDQQRFLYFAVYFTWKDGVLFGKSNASFATKDSGLPPNYVPSAQ